jgi:hypothetical protein
MVNHPPDWCAKRCGYPLDPVLVAEGWSMHPSCEFPESQVRFGPESDGFSGKIGAQTEDGPDTALTVQPGPEPLGKEQPVPHTMPRTADDLVGVA